jgi:hypothetical protein
MGTKKSRQKDGWNWKLTLNLCMGTTSKFFLFWVCAKNVQFEMNMGLVWIFDFWFYFDFILICFLPPTNRDFNFNSLWAKIIDWGKVGHLILNLNFVGKKNPCNAKLMTLYKKFTQIPTKLDPLNSQIIWIFCRRNRLKINISHIF